MKVATSPPKPLRARGLMMSVELLAVTVMVATLLVAMMPGAMPAVAQTTAHVTQNVEAQQAPSAPAQQGATADSGKLIEAHQNLGDFDLGGRKYSVVANIKTFARLSGAEFGDTLAQLEIRDASDTVVYQQTFPVDMQETHFSRRLSASASLLGGGTGSAIVIRFLDEVAGALAEQSFEVLGIVDGKLASFGAPLPLGQPGSGTAVNNVLTGVMVGGGVDVEPLMSTADVVEFRAWTGNFLVYVPARVDWPHGRWSEAEQCFALNSGSSPQQRGCNLRIAPNMRPAVDGSTITLFGEPAEDRYNAQEISLAAKSAVEFVGLQAVVKWKNTGDRFTCTFENVWLHVRIDGHEGWTHSEAGFAALGHPLGNPPG